MYDHRRKTGYWKYYHLAHTQELQFLVNKMVFLAKNGPGQARKGGPGRKRVHSDPKMRAVCLIMVALGLTYRDTQNIIPLLNLPWDEPVPDHTTIAKYFGRIPMYWLERTLAKSARLCIKESGWDGGMLAADSTAVETRIYEDHVMPDKTRREFAPKRRRKYLKWHITAILEHNIILTARTTSNRIQDSPVLGTMLSHMKKFGMYFPGSVFNADRGYDSDELCRQVFEMGMRPNIKQRRGAVNRTKRFRRRAAWMFDTDVYRYRGLIEGIFGAEESEHHQLFCRFHKRPNQRRFGLIKAIGWNIEVLNRIECEKLVIGGKGVV